MGKLVVSEFVSLDGVFEAPGPGEPFEHGGWTFTFDRGEEGNRFKAEELMAADAQLLGRVTYEGFAKAWPAMKSGEFAQKMNAMPKYVVSSELASTDWENSTLLRGPLVDEVNALKSRYAGDILVAGSGQLVRALLADGLVDELRLMQFPVILGSGKQLLAGVGVMRRMNLLDSRVVGADGVTILTYQPATRPSRA
jgi:dihydrofolate reductase